MYTSRDVLPFAEDAGLWDNFRRGDLEAFTELYNRYVNRLYTYGKRLGADSALVEDCIQDLFVELWHKKEHLGQTDSPGKYLVKAIRNKLLRRLSIRQKFSDTVENDNLPVELSYETALIQEQSGQEQQVRLQKALRQLTKRQREVIFLKFYENMSYQQIASLLSVEVNYVYNLVSLAMHALKNHM
jgi:RNA polymerase sigma factor (sigma-70 family)